MAPNFLKLDEEKDRLILSTSSPIDANKTCRISIDGESVDVVWKSASSDEPTDTLWISETSDRFSESKVFVVDVGGSEISVSKENPIKWNPLQIHSR